MQIIKCLSIVTFSVSLEVAQAVRALRVRAVGHSDSNHAGAGRGTGAGAGTQSGASTYSGKVGVHATIELMVEQMVQGLMENKNPGVGAIVKTANAKININDALRQLEGKLPDEVASLVRLSGNSNSTAAISVQKRAEFDENSLQKARRILNGMMFQAWAELDNVVFECKEFQERNRGAFEQVVTDIARLGGQLAKLGETRVSASSGIAESDAKRKKTEENLETLKQQFTAKKYENTHELAIRKNDLAVFDFILNATACESESAALLESDNYIPNVQVCSTTDGLELNFKDPVLQAKVEKLMTPEARQALREALGQVPSNFLDVQKNFQPSETVKAEAARKTMEAAMETRQVQGKSVPPPPNNPPKFVPVAQAPQASKQWKKCVDGTPTCGLLHDLMSLEWGKFRDSFDELTAQMKQDKELFDITKGNINEELTVINDEKTKHMEVLANTISNINANTQEMNEKDEQKRELTRAFDKACTVFREQITEILFTKICAVRKVRNELLGHSKVTPPSNVSDCDVSEWVSKSGECLGDGRAIVCDDSCPQPDPYKCGGFETMKRDVVVVPDANGMQCPPLERQKRCGQNKCPVDCVMSEWSGWSRCSKDCEGGVQARTRSIITKPKNGGTSCDSVQEDRPCNTGSCDRDCTLFPWTSWAPCSMACGGGVTKRVRKVLAPIRGQGRCPKTEAPERLEEKACNKQACIGDEICTAQQDLVIALDGSGSLKEDGFEILRQFTVNLTMRYKPEYAGQKCMKIGVVLFGNGRLVTSPDGSTTVSPAINVEGVTEDLSLVRQKISGLKWQRGFTNMAQGLTLADHMLSQGGRPDAQSAVLVISDGKYSFKYQTAEKAQELKDRNVMLFMAPVTETKGTELDVLKTWASQPWETNYEHIPGLEALKCNAEVFVGKLVAKFCPDSKSPSQMLALESQRRYMIVHENGWPDTKCGGRREEVGKVGSMEDCAAKSREAGKSAFVFGHTMYQKGICWTQELKVTQDIWMFWKFAREEPKCLDGTWEKNPWVNTYAIDPSTVKV